ncbi:hypothetical protein [Dactylosporangium sp. NPDC048998]|uniref:hypothetical protein n=1 Tax=Dactylosporangium sp. NPDC048998 TaxID=3363976 RepID=UPI003719A300
MESFVAAIIAVAGTLLGSIVTFVFQRVSAQRAERFARDERLRQERLASYSAFAGAITELRQSVISLWFTRRNHTEGTELTAAQRESDRLGAAADHARFRVQLLAEDPQLMTLADAAVEPIGAIVRAVDLAALREHETRCQNALTAFITAAGAHVR